MKRQPTTYHLTWLLDLRKNKQLDLNPPYQRKSVWTPKDKRFFLDTIFRNYPVPPIFVHRDIDDSGSSTYHVVDGKQRIETILAFVDNKIAIDKDFGDINLNGKKFSELSPEYKRKFWDYVLVVDFIESIEGTNIDEVFDRVNRNSKNLQPQELRHARFNGWFINEAESQADEKFWWDIKVSSSAKERRMKNVQFISELLLINLDNRIVGFNQIYLDEMYARYEIPEESVLNWDIDVYIQSRDRVKSIIREMNTKNKCIDVYGKTANNLYVLWALVSLNDALPDTHDLADRYLEFMSKVQEIIDSEAQRRAKFDDTQAEESLEEKQEESSKSAYHIYYNNSKGASTDFAQRDHRLKALESILL